MGTLCSISLTNSCLISLTNLVKSYEEYVFAQLIGFQNQGFVKIGPRHCFVGLLLCRVRFGVGCVLYSFRIENKEC